MYRDAPRPDVHAPKPLHWLVEIFHLVALWLAMPGLFVFSAWREMYGRILYSRAPHPLRGAQADALFERLNMDLPVRLQRYNDEVCSRDGWSEEFVSVVVLTFRNGDVVSFDAFACPALATQAHLCAEAGGARIEQHDIVPEDCLMVWGLCAALIESLVLAFFSKVIALLFAGFVIVTLLALIGVKSITFKPR